MELVLTLPILLFVVLGIMEMGNAYSITHAMTGLSREGANLAARGATLAQTAMITTNNGDDIDLDNRGGAIATRVVVQSGTPMIIEQATYGSVGASKIGVVGGPATPLTSLALDDDRVLYVVEVYYTYTPLTPLRGVLGPIIPAGFYERAIF